MKPSRLAEKLESRLGLLNASDGGRVTATIAKMSLVTILVSIKHFGNAWDCKQYLGTCQCILKDTSKTAFES